MEISPAAGKILGMLMAYAVSSLGLLLAYYNYRKRIIKADQIFSRTAKTIIISVISLAVVGAMLTAVAATGGGGGLWQAMQDNFLGLVLPLIIVLVSVFLTWVLYRHFSRQFSGEVPTETDSE